jgi:hypothetical protein
MTYAIKTLYPEFKCLTTFRKVMKRIDGVGARRKELERCSWKITKYPLCDAGDILEYLNKKEVKRLTIRKRCETREFNDMYIEFLEEYFNVLHNNLDGLNDTQLKVLKEKFPHCFRSDKFGFKISNRVDALMNYKSFEMNRWDTEEKKWEFNEAMISRDYKTTTLCDDVIGLVFEYL